MGVGYLTINTRTAFDALPVAGAQVTIKGEDGTVLYEAVTDENGSTDFFPLTAPDVQHTLDPHWNKPAYSVVDVTVRAKGYVTSQIHGVEIVDTQRTILPVQLHPLEEGFTAHAELEEHINIPPVGLLLSAENRQIGPPDQSASGPISPFVLNEVIVPRYITVHLGTPQNAAARNIRIPFIDYIKNVVSSEIYSTWPHNSLVANIHVIVTFALNRLFTEWYRSRGYNFDITNSTQYDQYYRYGGPVFENISRIVDGIFNVYARRAGFLNPFFTQYCNGTTVTCPGLSQWGTVNLANQGRSPLEILRFYYPNDLQLVTAQRIDDIPETYPGYSLTIGSSGEPVRRIQNFLNRIRVNYPLIPLIPNPNGVFDAATQEAVKVFQRTFNLTQDGVVGRATWNRITQIFVGITRLAELNSEGIRNSVGDSPPRVVLSEGSRGEHVLELQFILNIIAQYYEDVPAVIQDGVFGSGLKNAVMAFQRAFGLHPDGVVGPATWNKLYALYHGIDRNVPIPPSPPSPPTPPTHPPFPGTLLRVGSRNNHVRLMQQYLSDLRRAYPSLPFIAVDGIFGPQTQGAVIAFQRMFGLTADGIIGPITWNAITSRHAAM